MLVHYDPSKNSTQTLVRSHLKCCLSELTLYRKNSIDNHTSLSMVGTPGGVASNWPLIGAQLVGRALAVEEIPPFSVIQAITEFSCKETTHHRQTACSHKNFFLQPEIKAGTQVASSAVPVGAATDSSIYSGFSVRNNTSRQ